MLKKEEEEREIARKQDEEFDNKIETIMLKYGTISRPPATEISDKIDNLFARHQQLTRKRNKRLSQQSQLFSQTEFLATLDNIDENQQSPDSKKKIQEDDPQKLVISLRHDLDLPEIRQNLRKNRFKRDANQRRSVYKNPFNVESFQDTGEVLTLQGREIEEVGAFALAVELSRGACPMLQQLILSYCRIGNEGFARILQGMKMANIGSVRAMDLRGNFLSARALDYIGEIGANGAFSNLRVLNLSKNELGDTGVEALLRLFFKDLLTEIREIFLSYNSITDKGFRMIAQVFVSCQKQCCPRLKRLVLSNNLITGETRKEFWPLPAYLHL